MIDLKKTIQDCHDNLPASTRIYLNGRGISDMCINKYKMGFGSFYGSNWITIPINDHEGEHIFLKLRRDPNDKENKIKFRYYPQGIDGVATIYGWEVLEKSEMVVICEGEMDRLVLMDRGIPAITSTSGSGTFKREWLEVLKIEDSDTSIKKMYVCFDNDDAGNKGAEKVERMIHEILPHIELFRIKLPEEVGDHGDITRYFVKCNGTIDDLFSKYCTKSKLKPELKAVQMKEPFSSSNNSTKLTEEEIAEAKSVDCSNYVDIVKKDTDRNWALCSFHEEKTPSLCCYPGDRGFYCYGCGESGDTIKLVQKIKGLGFVDAVKHILNK